MIWIHWAQPNWIAKSLHDHPNPSYKTLPKTVSKLSNEIPSTESFTTTHKHIETSVIYSRRISVTQFSNRGRIWDGVRRRQPSQLRDSADGDGDWERLLESVSETVSGAMLRSTNATTPCFHFHWHSLQSPFLKIPHMKTNCVVTRIKSGCWLTLSYDSRTMLSQSTHTAPQSLSLTQPPCAGTTLSRHWFQSPWSNVASLQPIQHMRLTTGSTQAIASGIWIRHYSRRNLLHCCSQFSSALWGIVFTDCSSADFSPRFFVKFRNWVFRRASVVPWFINSIAFVGDGTQNRSKTTEFAVEAMAVPRQACSDGLLFIHPTSASIHCISSIFYPWNWPSFPNNFFSFFPLNLMLYAGLLLLLL